MVEWVANDSSKENDPGWSSIFFLSSSKTNGPLEPVLEQRLQKEADAQTNPTPVSPTSAAPGDDTSPPNAVEAAVLNAVVMQTSSSAGWSTSPPREVFHPSRIVYDIAVTAGRQMDSNSVVVPDGSASAVMPQPTLDMTLTLEYVNPYPDESMVVKLKAAKVMVSNEGGGELVLVSSSFQDRVNNKWIDITADISYTASAQAIVSAVLQDSSAGQTAGLATTQGKTIDVQLGPIGSRGRIVLQYTCAQMYNYEALGIELDGSDVGSHQLIPLGIFLPWSPLCDESGGSEIVVSVWTANKTVTALPADKHLPAYLHLRDQKATFHDSAILAVTDLTSLDRLRRGDGGDVHVTAGATGIGGGSSSSGGGGGAVMTGVGFRRTFSCLPPKPCCLLVWLRVPNQLHLSAIAAAADGGGDDDFDFVHISSSNRQRSPRSALLPPPPLGGGGGPSNDMQAANLAVVIQRPVADDPELLRASLPGPGGNGTLLRMTVTLPSVASSLPRTTTRSILNINISDSSGSTGARCNIDGSTASIGGGRGGGGGGSDRGGSADTVRGRFNQMSERRFLNRLSAIPALVSAGLLRPHDIWTDLFVAFDTNVLDTFHVTFRIGDIGDQSAVNAIIAAASLSSSSPSSSSSSLASSSSSSSSSSVNFGARQNMHGSGGTSNSLTSSSSSLTSAIVEYVRRVRLTHAQGGTSFRAAADGTVIQYEALEQAIRSKMEGGAPTSTSTSTSSKSAEMLKDNDQQHQQQQELIMSAFVDFDTDGGDNYVGGWSGRGGGGGGNCYTAIRKLVDRYNVQSGVVMGFGAWVNQHCASKVAKILGPIPALLGLHVPALEDTGSNVVFRKSLAAWVEALRALPVTLSIHAGSIICEHLIRGPRHVNAMEILAIRHIKGLHIPKFASPDITDPNVSGTMINFLSGGDRLVVYVVTRLANADALARRLAFRVNGQLLTNDGPGGSGGGVGGVGGMLNGVNISVTAEPLQGVFIGHEWLQVLSKNSGGAGRCVVINKAVAVDHLLTRLEDDVSFAFNLASPSGATSYLGRAKTEDHHAIDNLHQPKDPELRCTGGQSPGEEEHSNEDDENEVNRDRGGGGGPQIWMFAMARGGAGPTTAAIRCERRSVGPPGCPGAYPSAPTGALFGSAVAAPLSAQAGSIGGGGDGGGNGAVSRSLSAGPIAFGIKSMKRKMKRPSLPGGGGLFGSSSSAVGASGYNNYDDDLERGGEFSSSTNTEAVKWTIVLKRSEMLRNGRIGEDPSGYDDPKVVGGARVDGSGAAKLATALTWIRFTMKQVVKEPGSITYSCDVCHQAIGVGIGGSGGGGSGGVSWTVTKAHCFDCEDYDECAQCQGTHQNLYPMHRISPRLCIVSSNRHPPTTTSSSSITAEDPLVAQLLGSSTASQTTTITTTTATMQAARRPSPAIDRTVQVALQRVRRFLLAMADWWPVLLPELNSLGWKETDCPHALPEEIVKEIRYVVEKVGENPKAEPAAEVTGTRNFVETSSSSTTQLLQLASKIIDTIERQVKQ